MFFDLKIFIRISSLICYINSVWSNYRPAGYMWAAGRFLWPVSFLSTDLMLCIIQKVILIRTSITRNDSISEA